MKLLHTADIHLGIDTHGRLDPATGLSTRLHDFQRSFEGMVQRALDERVDAFLFAGDAYRTADPTPTQQRLFVECLRPLLAARIPIAMIVGNHDHPVSFGKASALDIFGFLDGDIRVYTRPGLDTIQTKAGPLQLIALPWPIRSGLLAREELRGKTPAEVRDLIEVRYGELTQHYAAQCDPALPTVLMGHFSVLGAELGGSERSSLIAHEPKLLASALAVPPVDYVALGHIHRHQNLNPDPQGVPVVYASSIERVSFKEMDDEKGFVLIDIDAAKPAGTRATYTFVPTPARRFVSVNVDAKAAADPTELVLAAIAKARHCRCRGARALRGGRGPGRPRGRQAPPRRPRARLRDRRHRAHRRGRRAPAPYGRHARARRSTTRSTATSPSATNWPPSSNA